jgi:hypothetical protein
VSFVEVIYNYSLLIDAHEGPSMLNDAHVCLSMLIKGLLVVSMYFYVDGITSKCLIDSLQGTSMYILVYRGSSQWFDRSE